MGHPRLPQPPIGAGARKSVVEDAQQKGGWTGCGAGRAAQSGAGRDGQATHALMMKSAMRLRQPIHWRGGTPFDAWKGSGEACRPESYRSLFVSKLLGKCLHKIYKSKVCGVVTKAFNNNGFHLNLCFCFSLSLSPSLCLTVCVSLSLRPKTKRP